MECEKLQHIDYKSLGLQYLLDEDDLCLYIGEYTSGVGWRGSQTNGFISNIKKSPDKSEAELWHKTKAEREASRCLARLIKPEAISQLITFVPIPPSKEPNDPLYDARMYRICSNIPNSHVLDLLSISTSRPALHENGVSASHRRVEDVYPYLRINRVNEAPRQTIFIVDDVITSGSNFKACKRKLLEAYPDRSIVGLFLAKCVPPPQSEPQFFDFDSL